MLKVSSSLYKIPYYNIEEQMLKSINRLKDDFQEVICMCATGGDFDGYKYTFKYSAQPTIEPTSYRLKGYTWNASLSYNDVGIDSELDIMDEVQNKIINIGDGIENDILGDRQNHFNNQQLSNKIFQKMTNIIYKGEVYNETGYLNVFVPSFTISSEIYLVNINQSVVYQ